MQMRVNAIFVSKPNQPIRQGQTHLECFAFPREFLRAVRVPFMHEAEEAFPLIICKSRKKPIKYNLIHVNNPLSEII
jgi:hypothetical protein